MSATPTRAVVAALIRKDLRLELRTRESVPAMALFSVSTFVLFHFGLDARSLEGDLAAGVFWVTLLFAAVLAVNRLFVAEREEGGFDGFLLAPVDRTALFLAKAAVLFSFLVALRARGGAGVRDPAARARRPGAGAAGADRAAAARRRGHRRGRHARRRAGRADPRARGDRAAARAAADDPDRDRRGAGHRAAWLEAGAAAVPGRWPAILGLYDLVFGLLAYAVFDYLLDE